MITLPRIHRFRFTKHHIRYFQGASVVFRAIESTSVARSFPEEKRSEDNSNNARMFASKETTKILRSILVLKLCSYDFVGRNSMAVRILTCLVMLITVFALFSNSEHLNLFYITRLKSFEIKSKEHQVPREMLLSRYNRHSVLSGSYWVKASVQYANRSLPHQLINSFFFVAYAS